MPESFGLPSLVTSHNSPEHALGERYVLVRQIGEGGMATVYLATDLKHSRSVAVKVLRAELASSVSADRFLREIHIAAGITHPHILPVHDSGKAGALLYYVMPYVEGETLADRLRKRGRLSFDDAIPLIQQMASALQHAHDQGVLHRDIKPGNVLLPGGVAVVADFGLARAVETDVGSERLTQTGNSLGTPLYMSPEQGTGEADIGVASDQYSLACVAYEMLAGRPPFEGPSLKKLMMAHVLEQAPPVSGSAPDVPDHVDAVLARALAKEPADRFASVREFAQALGGERTTYTSTRQVRRRVRRFAGANRLLVAAVLTAAAALGVWQWRRFADRTAPMDLNLLAVAPFETFDPTLAVWREGLVDILSRNLDGAGPISTVAPSTVVRLAGTTRADRVSARRLGRSTRAGLVVFGQLIKSGGDSVRATATLLDAVTDSIIGETEVRASLDRMDQLADSLAVGLLRELGTKRSIAAVPRTYFGARSLPALKAFLQGEQHYRRNDFASARMEYERALAEDSTFALAARRMRGVLRGLDRAENDSLSLWYAVRAGNANHGNTPRDSMLILADSLAAAHGGAYAGAGWLGSIRRRLRTLDAAATAYPDDPEVWTELGEVRAHFGEYAGIGDREALTAFERALAIDSVYGPAFYHAIDLTIPLLGAKSALPLVDRYVRLNPGDFRFRFVQRALAGASIETLLAITDTLSIKLRFNASFVLRRALDHPDVFAAVMRQATAKTSVDDSAGRFLAPLQARLLFRGRPREAWAVVSESLALTIRPTHLWAILAGGALDAPVRAAIVDRLVLEGTSEHAQILAPRLADVGDTTRLRALLAKAGSCSRDREPARIALCGAFVAAQLAMARADTTTALRVLSALPDSLSRRLLRGALIDWAQLLLARGDHARAAAVLHLRVPSGLPIDPTEVPWRLANAQAAEAAGDARRAEGEYAFVALAWQYGEPVQARTAGDALNSAKRLRREFKP